MKEGWKTSRRYYHASDVKTTRPTEGYEAQSLGLDTTQSARASLCNKIIKMATYPRHSLRSRLWNWAQWTCYILYT